MVRGKGRSEAPATYRVTLGYDGSKFGGYARQPNETTVEGVLRTALSVLSPHEALALAVGGRTDRGVHATGQVVSFKLPASTPPRDIQDALTNAHPALWIDEIRWVPSWFHAHFCARSRHYVYLAPLDATLSVDVLQRQLGALVGRRCFHAFARDTPAGQDTHRRLTHASVRATTVDGQDVLRFDLSAESFLRRMVRVLVATALIAARQKRPDALVAIAAQKDRRLTAPAAPPGGLYLQSVRYDPEPPRRS